MSNHGMVQLRTDSLDTDPEEGKLRDALGVQSPRATGQVKRYQCKKNKCNKISRCLGYLLLTIGCICLGLFLCFLEGVSGVYIFDKIDGRNRSSYYYPEPTELTARAWPHSTSRPMSCSDFYDPEHGDFGCCAIYDYRGLYNISWVRIRKDDINGTNCPTYEHLINNYVEYIKKYFTPINCTQFECCTMNYAIDRSIRENLTFPIDRHDPQYNIEVPVSNDYYTCRPRNVIRSYENYYEDPSFVPIIIIGIIMTLLYCLWKAIDP